MHREEFQLAEPVLGVGNVGVGDDRVLAHDVHAADPALLLHDLSDHQPLVEREGLRGHPPNLGVVRADRRVFNRPIVGVHERDRAHVGGALHVVLATHRHHRRTPAADHAAGEHEIEERCDQVGAVGVLRESHRPQGAGLGTVGIDLRRPPDALCRNAGDLRRHLGRHGPHRLPHRVEPCRARRDERFGFEPAGDDVIEHRGEQRHVRAGLHLEVDVGPPGELGAARIGHDERGAARVRALDRRAEHGVGFGRVGAGDEDDVRGVLHLAHRAGGRRGVERPLHRRDRGRMAQPGAVVDVVGAERSAEQPHEEVVLFIGALGRGEAGERVAAARAFDAQQLLRGELEGLVPGRLAERLVPRRRRSGTVADVEIEPLEQRQLAQ